MAIKLTIQNIKRLTPGTEMDIIISELILGICPHNLHAYAKDNTDLFDDYTTYRCRKCQQKFRGLAYRENLIICKNYSTDIANAWDIVKKMEDMGYEFKLSSMNHLWEANFYKLNKSNHLISESFIALTEAEAICKVALLIMIKSQNDQSN